MLWASAAPRLPQKLQMRFYLSYTEVGGVAMDSGQLEIQVVHLNASRWDLGTETPAWPCLVLGQPEPLGICEYWFQCSHFTAGQASSVEMFLK